MYRAWVDSILVLATAYLALVVIIGEMKTLQIVLAVIFWVAIFYLTITALFADRR